MSEQPILEVRGLEKEYPGVRALQGVDFDVRPGEVLAVPGLLVAATTGPVLRALTSVFAPPTTTT